MAVINQMISLLNMDKALMIEKREYVCAANVRKVVEKLGGLAAIYQDSIKERTLAKLIQADGAEVGRELARMHGVEFTGSQVTEHTSTFSGMETNRAAPRTCWYYLCCCCPWSACCASSGDSRAKSKMRKASPSLKEPLVDAE